MQAPLSVYLLIDKNNRLASEIFNRFYTLLCRDVEKPLSDGLDIPVYLISNDENGEIKIIEIGARMGGDFIGSTLVELSTGIDFVNAVIQVALGYEQKQPVSEGYALVF